MPDAALCYDDDYFADYSGRGAYTGDIDSRRYEADVRVRHVSRYLTRGRLLEIGSAAGFFLHSSQRAGFSVLGVEPSALMNQYARTHLGVDVRDGTIESVDLEASSFDLACAWHVLEHVAKPIEALRRVKDALKDDGMLFVEVPNIGSKRAQRELLRWEPLDLGHHVNQFQPQSLTRALEQAGYEVLSVESVPWAVYRRPPRSLLSYSKESFMVRGWPFGGNAWQHELLRAVARAAA